MLKKIVLASVLASCFAAPGFAQPSAATADTDSAANARTVQQDTGTFFRAAGNAGTVLLYGVGGIGSISGAGGGMAFQPLEKLVVRAEHLHYNHNERIEDDPDFNVDIQAKAGGQGLFVDFHPFDGVFRLVGGATFGNLNIDSVLTPKNNTVEYNGTTYTFTSDDRITADIKLPSVMPYIGIGWGLGDFRDGGLAFGFELGASYGAAKADLQVHGSQSDNQALLADVQAKEDELNTEFSKYKVMPAVKISLGYAF